MELGLSLAKLEVTEEAMRDVINCYTKNVEAIKSYTLDINERVGVIEDTLKLKVIKLLLMISLLKKWKG